MKKSLSVPCTPSNLSEVRDFSRSFFRDCQFDEHLSQKLVLAIDEATANAIIHGNHSRSERLLHLEMSFDERQFHARIHDVGNIEQMRIDQMSRNRLLQKRHARQQGGFGLYIMSCIMDSIEFINEGSHNVCKMTKSVHRVNGHFSSVFSFLFK